jgi:hypothetical protein
MRSKAGGAYKLVRDFEASLLLELGTFSGPINLALEDAGTKFLTVLVG